MKKTTLAVLSLSFATPALAQTSGIISQDNSSAAVSIDDTPACKNCPADATLIYQSIDLPSVPVGAHTLQKTYSTANRRFTITCQTHTDTRLSFCAVFIKAGDDSSISFDRGVVSYDPDGDIAIDLDSVFTSSPDLGGFVFMSGDKKAYFNVYYLRFLFGFTQQVPTL